MTSQNTHFINSISFSQSAVGSAEPRSIGFKDPGTCLEYKLVPEEGNPTQYNIVPPLESTRFAAIKGTILRVLVGAKVMNERAQILPEF